MAETHKTLIWAKRGKGWCMQVMHVMPGDLFTIAAQLDSGASNGWMGMMSREEAAELAEALTTSRGMPRQCAECGKKGRWVPGVLRQDPPPGPAYCPEHQPELAARPTCNECGGFLTGPNDCPRCD